MLKLKVNRRKGHQSCKMNVQYRRKETKLSMDQVNLRFRAKRNNIKHISQCFLKVDYFLLYDFYLVKFHVFIFVSEFVPDSWKSFYTWRNWTDVSLFEGCYVSFYLYMSSLDQDFVWVISMKQFVRYSGSMSLVVPQYRVPRFSVETKEVFIIQCKKITIIIFIDFT